MPVCFCDDSFFVKYPQINLKGWRVGGGGGGGGGERQYSLWHLVNQKLFTICSLWTCEG